jgi:hypothetical protein
VKWGRWWLALVYTVATLVAQGVHVHDQGADEAVTESRGDCDETRPHVAGHEAAAHGQAPAPCPSCQLRSQHSFWQDASIPLPGPGLSTPIELRRASVLPGTPLRTRCRAPPRV